MYLIEVIFELVSMTVLAFLVASIKLTDFRDEFLQILGTFSFGKVVLEMTWKSVVEVGLLDSIIPTGPLGVLIKFQEVDRKLL